MASRSERQPKLKICIDNTDPVEEIEEGEVNDSDDEDLVRNARTKKSVFSSRNEKSRLELVQQRSLPSPVASDEESLTVDMGDLETFGVTKKPKPKVYENPAHSAFELGFDPNSEDAVKKKNERAKRFGIQAEETIRLEDEDLRKLYESLKVKAPSNGFDERGIRFEAIHLRGTDNMSTDDVFQYFQGYSPKEIEWIDDSSCNLIWSDKVAAARAMLGMSEDPSPGEENKAKPAIDTPGNTDDQPANGDKTREQVEECKMEGVERVSKDTEPHQQTDEGIELFEEEDDDELNLMSSDDEESTAKATVKPQQKQISSQQSDVTMATSQEPEKMEASDEESDLSDKETSHKREQKPVDKDVSKVTKETAVISSSNAKMMKRILPPGNWRVGRPCEKAKFLFMRFATKADRKLPGAERKSQYYKRFGNPNYGGMRGLISASRKRKLRTANYRREQKEAENFVRKSYYHGIPEETSFDEHLRQAKKAKRLLPDSDHEDYLDYNRGHPYGDSDNKYNEESIEDDLASYWAEAGEEKEFELGRSRREGEEMDMERELGELMKKAPSYRYGRMYADDLEDQLRAKRETTQLMTFEVVDNVISTANRQVDKRKTDSRRRVRDSTHRQPHRKRRYHSDDEGTVQRDRLDTRDSRRGEDLRSQLEQRKGRKREHQRRAEGYTIKNSPRAVHSDQEVELELGVAEDEDDDGLELSPSEAGGFKYEKLRIQVDPDDV